LRIEQSVGSYPTLKRTVTADISPIYKDFLVWSSFDRQRTLQLTLTVPVLVGVSELSNFFSSAPGVLLVINEMICLYLVITRLRTTNQLSTNQLSHAVKPVNQ